MSIGTILIIILILVLLGVIPTWGHSRASGYGCATGSSRRSGMPGAAASAQEHHHGDELMTRAVQSTACLPSGRSAYVTI